ncbi:MAG: hypothetical protein ABW065_04130 [Solirubrobacterales bacterium]
MSFNLKSLVAAAITVVAVSAGAAPDASAAEFHCSVDPCRVTVKPDGTGKTAHQVFQVWTNAESESFAFTCDSISGDGTLETKTSKELELTNVEYHGCLAELESSVKMNGCTYLLNASGQMSIKCPKGKQIEWAALKCTVTIGEQGSLSTIKYQGVGGGKSELTVQTTVAKIKATVEAGCAMKPGEAEGRITTASFILTAETDNEAAEMANVWWE